MTKKPVIHHPGKILREEFLLPTQISPLKLARNINVSSKEIKEVINEQRDLTKDVATRNHARDSPPLFLLLTQNESMMNDHENMISKQLLKQSYQIVQQDLLTTFQKMKNGDKIRLPNIGIFEKKFKQGKSCLPESF
ncbi:7167_t:CDS:2, partial [Funneliformis geosporum]